MTYTEVIQSIANGLLNNFDNIYHSAEIITIDNNKFPAVSLNNQWINLSPTDTKEIIYIRRNGDDEVIADLEIGGCVKSYKMRSPLRIIYFKDHSDDKGAALFKLMQSILKAGIKLNKVIRDKYKLLKDESNGDYSFGAKAAYFAIDIYALWTLIPDTCEDNFCIELENPFCKQ